MSKTLLIIGSALNCGSPGHICESIGLMAHVNDWDVYMAHGLRYANPSKLKTFCVSSHAEEYLHILKSLLCDGHGLASKYATQRLIAFIEKIQPTVINIHNLHGYYLNYQVLFEYLAKKNIPVVWTLHDFWAITGHCVHFDYIGCNKWQIGCESCPNYCSYPKSLNIENVNTVSELKEAKRQELLAKKEQDETSRQIDQIIETILTTTGLTNPVNREIYVREKILKKTNAPADVLHKMAVKYVKAAAQCEAFDRIEISLLGTNIPGQFAKILIPNFCKQNLVFRIMCDFFDICSVHFITNGIISQTFFNCNSKIKKLLIFLYFFNYVLVGYAVFVCNVLSITPSIGERFECSSQTLRTPGKGGEKTYGYRKR